MGPIQRSTLSCKIHSQLMEKLNVSMRLQLLFKKCFGWGHLWNGSCPLWVLRTVWRAWQTFLGSPSRWAPRRTGGSAHRSRPVAAAETVAHAFHQPRDEWVLAALVLARKLIPSSTSIRTSGFSLDCREKGGTHNPSWVVKQQQYPSDGRRIWWQNAAIFMSISTRCCSEPTKLSFPMKHFTCPFQMHIAALKSSFLPAQYTKTIHLFDTWINSNRNFAVGCSQLHKNVVEFLKVVKSMLNSHITEAHF